MAQGDGGRPRPAGLYRWLPPAGILIGVIVGIALGNPGIGAILAIVLGLGAFVGVRLLTPRDQRRP